MYLYRVSLRRFMSYALLTTFVISQWWVNRPVKIFTCREDYANSGKLLCRPKCSHGFYSLPSMDHCEPWLGCAEIESKDFHIRRKGIGLGAVKVVKLARWRGESVVVSTPNLKRFLSTWKNGLQLMSELQPDDHVTQLIGRCRDIQVTEFYPFGSLRNLHIILQKPAFRAYDVLETRFRLCRAYVQSLIFFHDDGRVMCDSNYLRKALSQYLLTSDLSLVINDVDVVPRMPIKKPQMCGQFLIHGDLVAPEQRQKRPRHRHSPPFDEKSDIWKIPDVCEFMLEGGAGSVMLKTYLADIHKRCKAKAPQKRPTARDVLEEYQRIQHKMGL